MSEAGARLYEELMRFRPEGMTANAWAVRAGVSRTIWADLRRHGNPSRRTLSKLLEAAGSSLAEFEALRIGRQVVARGSVGQLAEANRGWGQAPLAPLPVMWSGAGGRWGDPDRGIELMTIDHNQIIDRAPRPPSLAGDLGAFAIAIMGEAMWPRFRQGRRIAVSPSSPIGAGDDVLVILAGDGGALIGELRSQAPDAISLRQFNPQTEFDVPVGAVSKVHKVQGELI